MNDQSVRAAFEAARQDNYQHPEGLDPDLIAEECSALIDAVDELPDYDVPNEAAREERQSWVLQESFVRAFEAGLAVGLEASQEGVAVTIQLDEKTLSGLVQRVLSETLSLKE